MGKIIGITAEYNPFHRGHFYQIETLRREEKDACVVAALSGSFLQRGVPALLDKWTRAEMAPHFSHLADGCSAAQQVFRR